MSKKSIFYYITCKTCVNITRYRFFLQNVVLISYEKNVADKKGT